MSGRKLRKEGKVLVKILDKSIHKHLISPSSQRQQIAQFESWHEAYVTLKFVLLFSKRSFESDR